MNNKKIENVFFTVISTSPHNYFDEDELDIV